MGFFDNVSDLGGGSHRHHSSGRHHSSSSLFGLGGHHNSSRSSFFGGKSSSYYKRSPRSGYLRRIYSQLRRLLRDLIYYMKRHPMKVFVLVIMPLITGGALTGLLSKFGIRLPGGMERMFGGMGGGTSIGRGAGGSLQFERSKYEGPLGGRGGLGGMASGMGGMGGLMSMAKMFM